MANFLGSVTQLFTALGLASLATQSASAVNITGGTIVHSGVASSIWVGTDNASANSTMLAAAGVPQILTDAATVAWNMASGFNANVTLAGNRTMGVPTNPTLGRTYLLSVIQDGTGSRTIAWSSSFNWGAVGAPTLTTTAGKRDLISLYCTNAGTTPAFICSVAKGF